MPGLGPIGKVEIRVRNSPDAAALPVPCTVTLEAHDDLEELGVWFEEIDWTQAGQDLSAAKLPDPDGTVVITRQDGGATTIAFYWDDRVVHPRANRLINADMPRLRRLALGACK
jgi:hypothetical protein